MPKAFEGLTLRRPPAKKAVVEILIGDTPVTLEFKKPGAPETFAAKELSQEYQQERINLGPFIVDGEPVINSPTLADTCAIMSFSQVVNTEDERLTIYDFIALSATNADEFTKVMNVFEELFSGDSGNLARVVQTESP